MIRHRPYGSEHPYESTSDQRVPADPLGAEPIELRVHAARRVRSVACEWLADGAEPVTLALRPPAQPVETPGLDVGGHLAVAQARASAARQSWSVRVPALAAGTRARYRFVSVDDQDRRRRTRWFETAAAEWVGEGHPLAGTLKVDGPAMAPRDVKWLLGPGGLRRVRFSLPLARGEHVVGFGERFDRVDQRGHTLDATVFEQYKSQGRHGRTYLPMPFAMVVGAHRTWGLHVGTSRRTWYDVGAGDQTALSVEADLDGDDRLTLTTYTGSPAEVLDAFLAETGRPEELPDWVFRLWASGNEWNTQDRVMHEMDQHRDLDVPVGALVIEAWSDESTFTAFRDAEYDVHDDGAPHRLEDFTFPEGGAWPDPKGMVDEMHDRGVKVLLWQVPLLKARPHPTGQLAADTRAAIEQDHVIREADGRPYRNRGWWFPLSPMPDFSTQRTRDWWTAKRRYLVEEMGVDGFKTDGGEHAWGHDLVYADGRRGAEGNNLNPVNYARAYGDLLRSCGKAPVTFSRAGFVGSQAHGVFWAGDEDSTWEAFTSSITAGITASACGILYWGWDIAGFSGDIPEPELYLRATAASCFMPIMQYHSEFHHHRPPWRDRTPWNVAERTGDDRVLPIFRRFAHLREQLVPYLAAEASAAIASGEPLMRGLFFDNPSDPLIWDHPHQFLIGRDILVAPVVEPGAEVWSTYLPEGDWVDIWTGEHHAGWRTVDRPVPLDEIPAYARADRWADLQLTCGLPMPPRSSG